MVINNVESDKEDIISGETKMKYCTFYIYLGTPITDSGTYISVINKHISGETLNCNPELPFHLKKKIAEACHFIYCIIWLRNEVNR